MWRRTILVAALAALLPLQSEQLDGAERRTQLLELLSESEKIFLFGPDTKDVTFELVSYKQTRRRKRFAAALARSGDDPGSALVGRLRARAEPRERFLDPHFLLLRRWSNRSEPLLDLPYEEDFDGCFYRSESAALFICGDIRGIVTANKKDYYFIHPLPERFHVDHNKIHVVVKRSTTRKKTLEINREENSDDDHFCVERNPTDKITENPATKRMWTKHRRKHGQNETSTPQTSSDKLERFKLDFLSRNKSVDSFLEKLSLEKTKLRKKRAIQSAIFVETAVFVDRDLYKHMTVNFPKDTERELVRFVLAMINAVQLLYHDPSLGRPVNFILKRLEILHEDPANLKRPHDIDRFLSNFCTWQRLENPPGDSDPLHWDHALILTGLDLYVVSKNGKVSSQVVGLAPVAGMCTVTSSCTVNEGRHFESVYVVAHEIGHNLGMRHDGPLADNGCDPTAYIMSPTLGSGKITWSGCSKSYLQKFLDTAQSRCLLDHASSAGQLDHSAEGILPGERFDADQQCMLKYGRGSRHAVAQGRQDVCRDLHCQRERYTWTSHPALEGTECGDHSWCRSGECVARAAGGGAVESAAGAGGGGWGRWSAWSECASGCLYGAEGRLLSGSTGVAVATRRCSRPRHEAITKYCSGPDKKFQSCHAQQCLNVPRVTVREFADQLCQRARELDPDLIGTGLQRMDSEDVGGGGGGGGGGACAVWCHTRGGGYKSRGWSLPDGTTCSRSRPMYCIAGTCQKFGCSAGSGEETEYSLRPGECEWEAQQLQAATPAPPAPSTASPRSVELERRRQNLRRLFNRAKNTRTEEDWDIRASSGTWRRAVGSQWRPASGCHYHCVSPGTGIRLVRAGGRPAPSIQLCRPDERTADLGCSQKKSPFQYATMVCSRYKERVRRLSGLGMQISPALEEPDRPCRVACQDERVSHRFYLVNGHEGWFPLGTSCRNASSYCVSGKCLEFGPDDTPVSEMVFTLPLISRSNLTAGSASAHRPRPRRSLEPERRVVTATLTRDHLHRIIAALNITENGHDRVGYFDIIPENIEVDFNHPIHIAPEETLYGKIPKPGEGWL